MYIDEFDAELVQKESDEWRNKQGFATTSVFENLQIAGDKVFVGMVCMYKIDNNF